jgi:hypothetical protein
MTNKSFENMPQFKNLGKNHNYIHEEDENRFNLGNTCYHSVDNILPSHLLPQNIKIKIKKL